MVRHQVRSRVKQGWLFGTAAAALLATAAQAQAQPQPQSGADTTQGASGDSGIAEVIVTAQRRSQRLQDVPVAVSAFTAGDLAAKQIQTTLDVPRLVPNMVGTNNVGIGSANTYFIRGLGNTESIATFDPPVGTYVDDIYVSRQNANNFSFFDVDRIEVLRGPQGTLFGRNTTGGAINVILKKPADHLTGYAEAGYGSYNRWTGRASIDVPLSEKILTKISAFGDKSDGYVHNLTTGERNNGNKSWGVRGAVRLLPSESVTWDVAADYIWQNSVNLPETLIDGKFYNHSGINTQASPLQGVVAGDKQNYHLQNITHNGSITSNIQISAGAATLSIITGYRHLTQSYLTDIFDGPAPTGSFTLANHGRFDQFSQEFKVNGKALDGRLDYVAGFFYIHENDRTDFADVFTTDFGGGPVPLVLADRVLRNTTSAPAVYAQFDYHLVPALTITIGGRYTSESKHVAVSPNPTTPFFFGSSYSSADIIAAGVPLSNKTSLFTPRFAIQYRTGPDFMVFASATRGFRSGGWNARALTADTFQPFGPEKVWSYEAGIRSETLDHRLRFNATAFYTDVRGFQVPLGFIDTTGAVQFVTQNGTDYRDYGLEAEVVFAPTRGLSLFANLGLQRAKYLNPDATITAQQAACRGGDAASCGQGIVNPQGDLAPPERTPHITAAFGGSYDLPLGSFTLTPAANASYQGRQIVGTAGVPGDYVDGQWLVGASVYLKPEIGGWKLGVECSNCLNNHFVGTNFPPGFKFYNMPRTWLVKAGYSF